MKDWPAPLIYKEFLKISMSIICQECGPPRTFKAITHRHLKFHHDMTVDEYVVKWPEAPLRDNRLVDDIPGIAADEQCQQLIGTLRPIEQQYVAARLKHQTKDAAARAVGISPSTVYNWKHRLLIEALVGYLQVDPILKGMAMIAQAVPDAVRNVADLQFSPDDRVALSASKDILERAGVTAKTTATTIDITIIKQTPTEQLDLEIARMVKEEQALEAQYKEIESGSPDN